MMLVPLIISQALFVAIVALGVIGTMIMSAIIIIYTVYEFRRKEIW